MILQADIKIQATARDRKRDGFAPPSYIACIHKEQVEKLEFYGEAKVRI